MYLCTKEALYCVHQFNAAHTHSFTYIWAPKICKVVARRTIKTRRHTDSPIHHISLTWCKVVYKQRTWRRSRAHARFTDFSSVLMRWFIVVETKDWVVICLYKLDDLDFVSSRPWDLDIILSGFDGYILLKQQHLSLCGASRMVFQFHWLL